jgi:hypothetical protein
MEFIVYQNEADHKLTAVAYDKTIHTTNVIEEASEFFSINIEASNDFEALAKSIQQGFANKLYDMMDRAAELIKKVPCTSDKEWRNCMESLLSIGVNQEALKPYLQNDRVLS